MRGELTPHPQFVDAVRAENAVARAQRLGKARLELLRPQLRERPLPGGEFARARPLAARHAGAGTLRLLTRAASSHTMPPMRIAPGTTSTACASVPTSER